MTTNPHQHEAELMLTEIAKDAGLTGPPLTIDQRITIASIHASLARTAAISGPLPNNDSGDDLRSVDSLRRERAQL